jgi:hypothetical protein
MIAESESYSNQLGYDINKASYMWVHSLCSAGLSLQAAGSDSAMSCLPAFAMNEIIELQKYIVTVDV